MQGRFQGREVVGGGGPAGDEADDGAAVPELFPGAEADALGQRLDLGIFQNHELLIGGAFAEEGAPGLAQDAAQLVGGCDGHTSHFAVKVVSEQRVELHAEQTPLGQQGAVLLGVGEEVPNKVKPAVYAFGLTVIGEKAVVPPDVKIGKNTAVTGITIPEDYPDGVLASGETLDKAGDVA